LDPPSIYHLGRDPSEAYPIAHDSDEYDRVRAEMDKAVLQHRTSLQEGVLHPGQLGLAATDYKNQLCCGDHSPALMLLEATPLCVCEELVDTEGHAVFERVFGKTSQ
jgi:hypothetical protein